MQYVIARYLVRVAIIVVQPAENISDAELDSELRKRLDSKSFAVDRVTILDDQQVESIPGLVSKRK